MLLNDFKLKGYEIRVSASLPLSNESAGGQTNSSTRINKGLKPKDLNISLLIRFSDAADLTELVTTASVVDAAGAMAIYDIVDPLANAMSIKQVQFVGSINVSEVEGKKAWQVLFKLAEHLSVPEIAEQREETGTPVEQAAAGTAVGSADAEKSAADPELTGFKRLLKSWDDALAPSDPDAPV